MNYKLISEIEFKINQLDENALVKYEIEKIKERHENNILPNSCR